MTVAQIENGEVVNVILLSAVMLEQFRQATGQTLIPIPEDTNVIVGDLYDAKDHTFHRPEIMYEGDRPKIVSLADLQRQISDLTAVVDGMRGSASDHPESPPELEHVSEPIPDWKQPEGMHDAYNVGDTVHYQGEGWRSLVGINLHPPGAVPGQWEPWPT
ncbi:MAG: hypothetical protein FWD25_11855 [Clostridia bacterium]|nr:hypothetical protein [Clostridia bacterium]